MIKHDRPITGSSFHAWFGDCLFKARVPYRKPHTTRHTYATAWRRAGLSMDDTAVSLGHADPKTTKVVYDHTTIFDVRRRMEPLEPAVVKALMGRVANAKTTNVRDQGFAEISNSRDVEVGP